MASENELRLERAQAQRASIDSRSSTPYERVASVGSLCPACGITIIFGDRIASPVMPGTSWRHLSCAICRHCGAWLNTDGACSDDCTAGQAEPEAAAGTWHDAVAVLLVPEESIHYLHREVAPPYGEEKLPYCRIISCRHEAAIPPSTMALARVHLQIRLDATYTKELLTRMAGVAIGRILGNDYDMRDIETGKFGLSTIACNLGPVTLENEQQLSRKPAWAGVS